jgi:predicted enzyme related to lactoylglutathione lyase
MNYVTTNAVAHLDIAGPDHARLSHFYQSVFDWHISPRGPGYALVETPGPGPNAAITEAETASVVLGIAVRDLTLTVAHAIRSGGREVMAPVDNGWVTKAQVLDPAGNLISLIQQQSR